MVCVVLWCLQVEILAGKDKGKHGRVSMVMRPRNALIVEGLNAVSIVCTVCVCVCVHRAVVWVLANTLFQPSNFFPVPRNDITAGCG